MLVVSSALAFTLLAVMPLFLALFSSHPCFLLLIHSRSYNITTDDYAPWNTTWEQNPNDNRGQCAFGLLSIGCDSWVLELTRQPFRLV
jgi:hypothetical protein